jgi:hypothetical protein
MFNDMSVTYSANWKIVNNNQIKIWYISCYYFLIFEKYNEKLEFL